MISFEYVTESRRFPNIMQGTAMIMKSKYPKWASYEEKQEYRQALIEQRVNEIYEDSDVVENLVEFNADVITEMFLDKEIADPEFGIRMRNLIHHAIESMAENDVDHDANWGDA